MRKQFDIPAWRYQSTNGARRAYWKIWGVEWPHDDDTLREMAREVPRASSDCYLNSRCEQLLIAMRECHEF